MLAENGGKFLACWSHDDDIMRSRNRSVLETSGRISSADDAFLAALRTDDGEVKWRRKEDLRDLRRRLAAWRLEDQPSPSACTGITFRLSPPAADTKASSGPQDERPWKIEVASAPDTREGLQALGAACRIYPTLRGISGTEMEITAAEAEAFLRTGATSLRDAGYRVELPKGMDAEIVADAQLVPTTASKPGSATDEAVRASVTIRVAGEKVTRNEIAFLLDQGTSMVFFRGHWIEVDRSILKAALKVLDEVNGRKMSEREAVSFAMGFGRTRRLAAARVKGTGWFGTVLADLRSGGRFRTLPKPKGFNGRLRPYQRRGYSWLKFLTDRSFGALLADDMGLGKTVQTIAWILKRRELCASTRVLIVTPVSVTINWMRELKRFAPGVKALLHQGRGRLTGESFARTAADCTAVVTGYPLLMKDFRMLADAGFDALVLDEAQKIKNPDTQIARAARAFPCSDRIALTGTPFENRVTDLWSIEEFLNAGLLGPRSDFERDFDEPMHENRHSHAATELRKMLAPFLLRRLKSDPGIAAELGPKREIREYCALSPRQRTAYEVALARYANIPREGRGGKGDALALLTELKLICDGLNRDGSLQGGKAERLVELLESIFDAGESALVFTQYVKVGEMLKALVEAKLGRKTPFLHGGLSTSAREAQIAAFNAAERPSAFILSLKAGGFGLNLTKATHVIHFDRWWNPAIENQATDRAHRIGQSRPVFIHLFITHGTLEDRIDAILEEKSALADELITSGESFLLKMGADEFARTVSLS